MADAAIAYVAVYEEATVWNSQYQRRHSLVVDIDGATVLNRTGDGYVVRATGILGYTDCYDERLVAVGVVLLVAVPPLGVGVLVVGVLFALSAVALAALAQVPVVTYLRYYALFVLGDVDPDLDLIPDRRGGPSAGRRPRSEPGATGRRPVSRERRRVDPPYHGTGVFGGRRPASVWRATSPSTAGPSRRPPTRPN